MIYQIFKGGLWQIMFLQKRIRRNARMEIVNKVRKNRVRSFIKKLNWPRKPINLKLKKLSKLLNQKCISRYQKVFLRKTQYQENYPDFPYE